MNEDLESPFPKFLHAMKGKKRLLLGLFLAAFSVTLGFSLLKYSREKSFQEAFQLCHNLNTGTLSDKEVPGKIDQAFQFKEIKDRFESLFAQKSLKEHNLIQAKKWMKDPLKSLKKVAPEYVDFSKVAYGIVCKDYQKSLQKSLELEQRIDPQERPFLYLCNLYRISFLYEKLANPALAKKYLQKLQKETQKESSFRVPFDPWRENISFQAYLKKQLDA